MDYEIKGLISAIDATSGITSQQFVVQPEESSRQNQSCQIYEVYFQIED